MDRPDHPLRDPPLTRERKRSFQPGIIPTPVPGRIVQQDQPRTPGTPLRILQGSDEIALANTPERHVVGFATADDRVEPQPSLAAASRTRASAAGCVTIGQCPVAMST